VEGKNKKGSQLRAFFVFPFHVIAVRNEAISARQLHLA